MGTGGHPRKTDGRKSALHQEIIVVLPRVVGLLWIRTRAILAAVFPPEFREFPAVDESTLDRFDSWDAELGWRNQPNVRKPERQGEFRGTVQADYRNGRVSDARRAYFTTDRNGSRIPSHPSSRLEISVFGDSYAMCREVGDSESWPFQLGELRKTRVLNYGVGNYGLDQALLLMESMFEENQEHPDYTILAITTASVARCASVYRHYFEKGNVLAIKPRFHLDDDVGLILSPYPFKRKEDLLRLKSMKRHLKDFDDHRNQWLQRRRRHYMKRLPILLGQKLGLKIPLGKAKPEDYELQFWVTHKELFSALINRFSRVATDQNSVPVLLLQHQRFSLESWRNGLTNSWMSAVEEVRESCADVVWLDESAAFEGVTDVDALYSGAHHSPHANQLLANYLNTSLPIINHGQ